MISDDERSELERIFPGASQMSTYMRSLDWSRTDLGRPRAWPENLRISLSLCLTSRIPIAVFWGRNDTVFYNDSFLSFLSESEDPRVFGRSARDLRREIWETIEPLLRSVYETGQATWSEGPSAFSLRRVPPEEVYIRFTLSPILAADGNTVEGVFCHCIESAGRVIGTTLADSRADQVERRATAEAKFQQIQREAEAALRASEEKFSAAFDRSPLALTITSLESGRLVEVNEGFLSVSGYTRDEALGRTPRELSLWIEPEHHAAGLARLRAGESISGVEARFRMKDGEERIGVIGSTIIHLGSQPHVLSSVIDITDRKRAEEIVHNSEKQLALISNNAPVILAYCDAETRYKFVNRAFADRFGLTPAECIGKRIPEVLGEEAFESFRVYVEAALRGQPVEFEVEVPYATIDARFIRGSYAPEIDSNGRVVGFVAAISDITELKRVEAALRETDRRKDEFLAMLAHELRNPLAPIRNAVQVLKLMGPVEANQQWAREVIERQVQHLTRLVDDLLDVSRITQGRITLIREPLDLSTIINRAVETSRPLLEARKHQLTITLPPGVLAVEGDLTRLVQVVSNLFNNAAKYTDEGGQISIEGAQEGDEAIVRVRDNGTGLSPELLPHVFDLFIQADRSLDRAQGGLGIGLTLVRRLIELHGGRVEARSEGLGRGSEFILRLPIIDSDAASRTDALANVTPGPIRPKLRILVVEDNLDSAEMLAFMLKLGGHEVKIVHDGSAVLAAARSFSPQVILCDIGLPGMSGYEVAAQLRSQSEFEPTRIIAVSGYGQEEDQRRASQAGFNYHLTKPVDPEALEALIDSLRSTVAEDGMIR